YGPRYAETTAAATDGFKILEGITIPAQALTGAAEPSGSRVNRILTAAQWYTDHRNIAAGDSELQATTFGATALNPLPLTADSDIGELDNAGSANFVFRQRRDILEDTRSAVSQGVFGDGGGTQLPYQLAGRANDDTTLANDVQITAAGSPNMQQARN